MGKFRNHIELRKTRMKKLLSTIIFINLMICAHISLLHASSIVSPQVDVYFQKSMPQYYSMPAEDVQNLCSESDYIPVGCTHYEISYHYDYDYVSDKKGAVQVSKFSMKFYYKKDNFYVYIDDKYPRNSCEYNAIKRHEDLHVKIDQTVEIKKVESELKKCLFEINKKNMKKSYIIRNIIFLIIFFSSFFTIITYFTKVK